MLDSAWLEEHFIARWSFYDVLYQILTHQKVVAMDILREFLESSTIHGLSYISTAQVILASLHTLSYPD